MIMWAQATSSRLQGHPVPQGASGAGSCPRVGAGGEHKRSQGRWVGDLQVEHYFHIQVRAGKLGFALLQWNFPPQKGSTLLGFQSNRRSTNFRACIPVMFFMIGLSLSFCVSLTTWSKFLVLRLFFSVPFGLKRVMLELKWKEALAGRKIWDYDSSL